ncbi:hypothetical protein CROQUDRAFT_38189 [Cronartium quercuum f. sp. fusiforme G11]|uniref:Serine/threonine-protein phosphatase 4 regulatory subunit 3-like central domain-containing protein n=1 Tax=Cronartium quercuum f. sp. fusiforme G11 TaxID=708437 RepID=A0A9P6NNU7_9BASI|nr:hypothetical protein CROQUDRAFT_38189 [Cronartium quercuum f. sp. fusiforme G11]
MVKWACRSSFGRERVSSYILRRDYVKKLQQVKVEAEDLESLKDLHALCTLVHSILMLNDAAIYEYCLQDDIVLIVAGILDYDPEFGNQKASYYADLSDPTRFKQVVPIKDGSIRAKIHQTYRLQYFKDIILARILDDSTFSIINSMIFFNQIDIVQYLHSNDEFMRELFGIFDQHQLDLDPVIGPPLPPSMVVSSSVSEAETMERKIDTILFIQQLSAMAKHLQPPSRVGFFRSLAERGVLKVIEFGLSKKPSVGSEQTDLLDDSAIKSAICEILITIIDYDPHSVRGYCLKQHEAKNRNLVECLIELLLAEPDLGLKVQLVEALRILLDTGAGAGPGGTAGMMMMAEGGMRREEDPENEKFLSFFYDHCFKQLSEPIHRLPEIKNGKRESKYVMLTANLPAKLASLLVFDRFKFLQLGSIRFFRACLNKHDDFYNRCFVKHDIFGPVLELLERQGAKDNLVKSACLEFFENIRLTNMKSMLNHLMDRDGQKIRRLADTNGLITFKNLIVRWEQNNESPPPPPPLASSSAPPHSDEAGPLGTIRNIGNWARTRTLEPEEENYFAQDSDEEDSDSPNKLGPIAIPTIPSGVLGKHNDIMESSGRKRARSGSLIDNIPSRSGLSRSRTQSGPFLSTTKSSTGLVDYEDESEEEEEEVEVDDALKQEPTKRRKSAEEEEEVVVVVEDVIKQEPPKRRKNAEEEEEDGAFARLKRSNVTNSLSTSSPMIRSSGFSIQGSRSNLNTSGLSALGGSKIVVSLSKSTVDSNGEKT